MSERLTPAQVDAAQALGQDLLDLLAGRPFEIALIAQADALASSIGAGVFLTGGSKESALALVNEISGRVTRHVSHNWGSIEVDHDA